MGKARLTQAQVTEVKKAIREAPISNLNVSPTAIEGYQGIDDEPYQTIAPGAPPTFDPYG